MPSHRSAIQTHLPVRFRTLNGDSLPAVLNRIELRYDADSADDPSDAVGACELLLDVDGDALQAILAEEWFHLFRGVRLDRATFDADGGARLLVALRPALLRRLASQALDAEDVFDALLPSADASAVPLSAALGQSESWMALELTQTVALPEALAADGTVAAKMRAGWRDVVGGMPEAKPTAEDAAPSLFDQVLGYLEAKQLAVEPAGDSHLRLRFHTDDAAWGSVVRVDEDARLVVLYSVFPTAIPAPLREETALAFIGEHYGSVLGCYEMDPNDGELRYRTAVTVEAWLDPSRFAAALSEHLTVMKRFVPIVEEVVRESGL